MIYVEWKHLYECALMPGEFFFQKHSGFRGTHDFKKGMEREERKEMKRWGWEKQ